MSTLTPEQEPAAIADALRQIDEVLEQIRSENNRVHELLESAGWSGLEGIDYARERLDDVRQGLSDLVEKFSRSEEVLQALRANHMVGDLGTIRDH